MFRSSADRLRTWLTGAGDLLWDDDAMADADDAMADADVQSLAAPEPEMADRAYHVTHPHRRNLRWQRSRRPGTVPARPAHCVSPVRHAPAPRPIPFP